MASTDAVQEHDTDLESGPSEFPRSAGEETSTEIAPPAEESQVPDGIDSIDDETSATTKASHKAKKRKGISQKIKNAFKGKRSGKYVPTKEHHEQTSQDSGGKAESEITTDTATSGEEARNSLDSSDGKPEKSTLKRAHEEMTVKFRQHTRIVNVPVEQNSDWLNSIKVAVVAKFHDLLFPDAKEAELIFEKMKNNLLFQVYNADHGEFIDLTNDTILTEKAKLRLVMIPMTYGEADGTASSVKELVTDENILDQKKVIVVFGKHTRRVNIPARQGNEWMNSLKLAVVENFLDLLSPNGKQAEATFEKVKDGILLQVYDQTYDAFVDMTNDEVLPENANLKLEVINNCHEGTGGKALLKEYTAGMDRVSIKDKDVSVKFRQITRLVKLPAKQNPGWLNSFKLNVREVFQDMLDDEDSIDLEVYNSLVDEYIKLEEHHNLGFWDIVLVEVSSRNPRPSLTYHRWNQIDSPLSSKSSSN